MEEELVIRKLREEEWEIYRDLREEATRNEETAYSVTPFDQHFIPKETWMDMLKRSEQELYNFMYFAEINKEIVGMLGAVWESSEKSKHTASVIWLYVKPEYRRQKIASHLLIYVLEKLKTKKIQKVKLLVTENNSKAINLYKSLGFEEVGRLHKELLWNGTYYDEILMEKFLI